MLNSSNPLQVFDYLERKIQFIKCCLVFKDITFLHAFQELSMISFCFKMTLRNVKKPDVMTRHYLKSLILQNRNSVLRRNLKNHEIAHHYRCHLISLRRCIPAFYFSVSPSLLLIWWSQASLLQSISQYTFFVCDVILHFDIAGRKSHAAVYCLHASINVICYQVLENNKE